MTTTIITGGAGGIGAATASHLLTRSGTSHVALVDRAAELPSALAHHGDRVRLYDCDVADPEAVRSTCALIVDSMPTLDSLVNCAGILRIAPSSELDPDEFDGILAVHLRGLLNWSQCFVGALEGRPAAIVNIGSIAGQFGQPRRLAYGAAKAAVESMTKTLAVEWADRGIRVNCVAPGYIRTPMISTVTSEGGMAEASAGSHSAMGRLGEAHEVATAIVFLLGEGASFITGQTLNVDGGFAVKKIS